MTQSNLAEVFNKIVSHIEHAQAFAPSIADMEIAKAETLFNQATQAQTKALAAELVELRAENGRLRFTLKDCAPNECNCDAFEPGEFLSAIGQTECPQCRIDQTLAQPTIQGFADAVLRLAVGAIAIDTMPSKALARTICDLTPEQIKLLEEMKGEIPNK